MQLKGGTMIEAELHGKTPDGYRDVEDLLTSAVLGLLQYVPVHPFWEMLFRRARNLAGRSFVDVYPDFSSADQLDFVFWPNHEDYGEPDLLAYARVGEKRALAFIIEVKLWSGKSSTGPDDQLARYLKTLDDRTWLEEKRPSFLSDHEVKVAGLIYLTVSPGEQDLRDSIKVAASSCPDAEDRLFALQWHDVHKTAMGCLEDYPFKYMLARAAEVLARRGLVFFDGFDNVSPPILEENSGLGGFYSQAQTGRFDGFADPPAGLAVAAGLGRFYEGGS